MACFRAASTPKSGITFTARSRTVGSLLLKSASHSAKPRSLILDGGVFGFGASIVPSGVGMGGFGAVATGSGVLTGSAGGSGLVLGGGASGGTGGGTGG